MNILINDYCNLKCPYCFAEDVMESAKCNPVRTMSLENFTYALDFNKKNNARQVRIIGGEPTLHPNFKEFLNMAVNDEFFDQVLIFSNCSFSDDILNHIIECNKKKKVMLLPNCNAEFITGKERYETMIKNVIELAKVGIVDTVGINIYDPNMDIDYIFDIANKANAARIRWSITVPNHKITKDFDVRNYFNSFENKIVELFTKAAKYGKTTGIDCNRLPICSFSDEVFKLMHMSAPQDFTTFTCDSILDCKPNLDVIRCFGLSEGKSINLKDVETFDEMKNAFDEHFKKDIDKPLFDQCESCKIYSKSGNKSCGCVKYRQL